MKCKRGEVRERDRQDIMPPSHSPRPPTQQPSRVSETRAWTTYYYYMRRVHKTKAISIEASHKICSKGNDTPSTKVQYLYDSRVLQKTKTSPTYTSYSPYKKKTTTLTHPIPSANTYSSALISNSRKYYNYCYYYYTKQYSGRDPLSPSPLSPQ